MNKIFILNRSLGELDWIVTHYEDLVFDTDRVIFICYRLNVEDVLSYAPRFFQHNNIESVISYKEIMKKNKVIKKIDDFLDRLSTFTFNKLGSLKQYQLDYLLISLKSFLSKLFSLHSKIKIESLYYENNDRTTCFLELIKRSFIFENLNFYPHHFGFTQPVNSLINKIHKKIEVSNCYVNFPEESGLGVYKYISQTHNINNLMSDSKPKILILTRQCSDSFGFSYDEAYKVLDTLLTHLKNYQYQLYIKNHPRDNDNVFWRKLTKKYDLNTIHHSAIDFSINNNVICFHLYTSLCFPLSKLGVRCYDVSPYRLDLVANNKSLSFQLEQQKRKKSTVLISDIDRFDFDGFIK